MLEQALEIDVQRTGEEQEAQHAVHERLVEVDLAEKAAEHFPPLPTWNDGISGHHDKRTHQRDGQRAGGGGELQDAVIDVAGEGRDGNEHGGRVKSTHDAQASLFLASFSLEIRAARASSGVLTGTANARRTGRGPSLVLADISNP